MSTTPWTYICQEPARWIRDNSVREVRLQLLECGGRRAVRQEVLDLLSAVGRTGGARVALEVVETMGMNLSDLACGRPRCAVPALLLAPLYFRQRAMHEVVGPSVCSDGA
ncbi:hypothetical protein IQ61_12460 [Streptomyces scabiei]|nr:hypothetical protein IQ61_12460 [Streptomyces scabiei]